MAVKVARWHSVSQPGCAPGWPLATGHIGWKKSIGVWVTAQSGASPALDLFHLTCPLHSAMLPSSLLVNTWYACCSHSLSISALPAVFSSTLDLSSSGLYFSFGTFLSSNHLLSFQAHSLKMLLLLCHTEGSHALSLCAHFY